MEKYIANKIFSSLLKLYPNPKTELKYINKFTFLISVVLSAQATDVSVNIVTKELFKIVKNHNIFLFIATLLFILYFTTIKLSSFIFLYLLFF